jgi:plasmid stabilization system protein ParE
MTSNETSLAKILDDLEADAVEGCTLETVVLYGTYTDGRGGYAGNLRRSLTPSDLRAIATGNAELRARLDQLTDRVVTAEEKNQDDTGLARENTELRRQLADTPTSEAAVAKLREWVPDYEAGASHIAMPVATARKLLDVVDRAENARDQIAGQLAEARNLLAASGRAEAIATALRMYADKLDAVPLECTALTGPVWYGQGWRDAVNHLRDLTDGLRTEPVAARGPDAGSAT